VRQIVYKQLGWPDRVDHVRRWLGCGKDRGSARLGQGTVTSDQVPGIYSIDLGGGELERQRHVGGCGDLRCSGVRSNGGRAGRRLANGGVGYGVVEPGGAGGQPASKGRPPCQHASSAVALCRATLSNRLRRGAACGAAACFAAATCSHDGAGDDEAPSAPGTRAVHPPCS
jgi:hypothetical protein